MSVDPTPPSAKQLRYLRELANQRGESFAYPHTKAEAQAEIARLKSRRPGLRVDRYLDRYRVSRDLAFAGDGARVRGSEIAGWGANAHWK